MAYHLPALPYPYDSLEPYIDTKTMEIHHDKHHNAYVTKLNTAVASKPDLASKSVEDLISHLSEVPSEMRTSIRNNGGGHANHALFWTNIGPQAGGEPAGELAQAIKKDFGSFEVFKDKFSNAAATQFGSGWAWLTVNDSELCVCSTPNQDSPIMDLVECKGIPILCLDVWEHAYYLKYQNRRPDYISAFWNLVNWQAVEEKYNDVKTCSIAK